MVIELIGSRVVKPRCEMEGPVRRATSFLVPLVIVAGFGGASTQSDLVAGWENSLTAHDSGVQWEVAATSMVANSSSAWSRIPHDEVVFGGRHQAFTVNLAVETTNMSYLAEPIDEPSIRIRQRVRELDVIDVSSLF